MSHGQLLQPREAEDGSCRSTSGLPYLEAGSKTGMGTIPSDSAPGAEPVVLVHPEKEVSEFRAAPSLGDFQQGLLEEEWTGPQLMEEEEEEEEEEDGSEGKGPRSGPAADDPSGSREEEEEEEPSMASPVWHPNGGLGEVGVDSGGSLGTQEACGTAGPAALGQEEEDSCPSGNAPRLPLREEEEEAEGACLLGSKVLGRGAQGALAQPCCIEAEDPVGDEQECPICTELYDQDQRKPALLNCSHVLCSQCLQAILQAGSAADIGRVRCPICRQKTPMMEWEICKLQEELLLLSAAQGPAPPTFPPLPPRQPGFWGGLEHHFHVRFHTGRVMGFFPCLRYPACLVGGLAELERRCPWCYRMALLALAAAEMLSLLLVFLPILLLLLLFLILDK